MKIKNNYLLLILAVSFTIFIGLQNVNAEYLSTVSSFKYNSYIIPSYDGDSCERINNNIPKFTSTDRAKATFESYSNLDSLKRCGIAFANIDQSLMPTTPRGSISSVTPSGWVQAKYDNVPGKYLYNRSHLIGWQLTGENANKNNLITGTYYMNHSGMLSNENSVASYIKNTNNHVLYRVTPVFTGNDLVAKGVIMEAESLEDSSIKYNVFCYNLQPGISIDYRTGNSILTGKVPTINKTKITKIKAKKKSLKVTYSKVEKAQGYEIAYKKKKAKAFNYKTTTKTKVKIKKLKSNKKYKIKVRAYIIDNGKKIYSDWSKTKTVKTK